jgi:hypothetical protein
MIRYTGIILILIGLFLSAGCSQYAEPELTLETVLTQVSSDPSTGAVTYDVLLTVRNTGSNNAYDVSTLLVLGTPKDLPEYRFVSSTVEIGDVGKGKEIMVTKRMTLEMTPENYDLISSGQVVPMAEATVMRMSSNVMG